MAQKLFRKTYHADTKAAEGKSRTLIVTISTVNPDRSKDVVVPSGMDADNYMGNPVVAAFHRYDQPAIGRTKSLQVLDDRVVAEVEFLPKGIYPLADQLYEMYKAGFMNAWSIGFIPKERTDLDPDNWMGGYRFDKWELLEYSAVTVPDNPEALTMLRSKGFEVEDSEGAPTVEEITEAREQAEAQTKQLEETSEPTNEQTEPESPSTETALREIKETLDRLVEKMEPPTEAKIQDPEPDPTPTPPDQPLVLPLVDALRMADKAIGNALRKVNEQRDKAN